MKHFKVTLFLLSFCAASVCHANGFLPFWADQARANGADLPEPFGINFGYMHIQQGIDVNSISFDGLSTLTPTGQVIPIPSNFFQIEAGKTREKTDTQTFRFDAWVLPFLNVYAILGQTSGSSVSDVSVSMRGAKPPNLQNLPFVLDFDGTTYGGGLNLAWGIDKWFGSLDANYTRTNLDVLDGGINSWVFTPRVGYRFDMPSIQGTNEKSVMRVWVGGMYQNIQQTFSGDLTNLNMPSQLSSLVTFANISGDGKFNVRQKLQTPWNWVAGAQFQPIRNANITFEGGFGGHRQSVFLSGELRF